MDHTKILSELSKFLTKEGGFETGTIAYNEPNPTLAVAELSDRYSDTLVPMSVEKSIEKYLKLVHDDEVMLPGESIETAKAEHFTIKWAEREKLSAANQWKPVVKFLAQKGYRLIAVAKAETNDEYLNCINKYLIQIEEDPDWKTGQHRGSVIANKLGVVENRGEDLDTEEFGEIVVKFFKEISDQVEAQTKSPSNIGYASDASVAYYEFYFRGATMNVICNCGYEVVELVEPVGEEKWHSTYRKEFVNDNFEEPVKEAFKKAGIKIDLHGMRGSITGRKLSIVEKFKSYDKFFEEQDVKLEGQLREYELSHLSDDKFDLKSDTFQKNFSVKPYDKVVLPTLQDIYGSAISALHKHDAIEIFNKIKKAEGVNYKYGNVFNTPYSLRNVPSLMTIISDEQRKIIVRSETEFMGSEFSKLTKTVKDSILASLKDRAEVLCCVIEALFYYVRLTDKDEYYNGMSKSEILEEYKKALKTAADTVGFRYEGPTEEERVVVWKASLGEKKFEIRATADPVELHAEENIGGTQGLKFSIVENGTKLPEKDYAFFSVDELAEKIKSFTKRTENEN